MGLPDWVVTTSDRYAALCPAVPAVDDGACRTCRDLVGRGYRLCRHCRKLPDILDAAAPVALSVRGGMLHTALRGYKDSPDRPVRERCTSDLAALLWRFLAEHEHCLAGQAGIECFDVVTTVPSSSPLMDQLRPRLRHIVGSLCAPSAPRYRRALHATGAAPRERTFDPTRFWAEPDHVASAAVLLVDDTWVTGARMLSAARALRDAGAATVAAVAIGRHIDAMYGTNAARLIRLPPADPSRCALEPRPSAHAASPLLGQPDLDVAAVEASVPADGD
jgi:predicted amidophosphoribosyltransferase